MGFVFPVLRLVVILVLVALPGRVSQAQGPAVPPPGARPPVDLLEARRQTLAEEQANLERLRQEVRALSENIPKMLEDLEGSKVTESMVEQAQVDAETVRLRLEDLQADIATTERRIKELEQTIRDLEAREQLLRNPAAEITDPGTRAQQLASTVNTLTQRRTELELERQHLENLRKRTDLAALRLSLVEQSRARLEDMYRRQQEQSRRVEQEEHVTRLQREYQAFLDSAAELSAQLEQERDSLSEARRRWLETRIQVAEERARLIQLDIRLARASDELARLDALAVKAEADPKELYAGIEQLRNLQVELQNNNVLLNNKITLYQRQKQAIDRREGLSGNEARLNAEEAKLVGDLLADLSDRQGQLQGQFSRLEQTRAAAEANYKERLSSVLLARRTLPGNAEEWRQLLAGIMSSPWVIANQVRLSVETAVVTMVDAPLFRWLGLIAMELGLGWLVVAARRRLSQVIDRRHAEQESFVGTALLTSLRLLRRNLLGIGVAAAVLLAVWMFQVPQPGLAIITALVLLWVLIKVPVTLVWLLLAAPHLPPEKRDIKLYRQLAFVLPVSGMLAAVAILARLSSLPETLIGAFDRAFMLSLLPASWPLLRLRRYVIDLLATSYAGHVWFVSLRVISVMVPLTVFAIAVLGVVGYLNLAWTAAWHVLVFILVLMGWLIGRGLLNDLAVFLKNFAMGHSGYGLLWTQEIINPLYKISGMALFVAAWVVLFRAYGWEGDSAVVVTVWQILEQPLFKLGAVEISAWRVILTVLAFLLLIWFGQWIRAVTYRWVYSGIIDLGVRHSVSVFTQYFVVLVGLMVTLRVIGVDLTTLTVFAGAVGVGIGFGMQTIANNFISGLLLLIERPLKSGDLVQIGTNIGEITRIGIRSLTVKNFDSQEVMIPNSDVITSAFTNWTHSDNTMRTVLMIGVSYKADPHRVKALIERVIREHPWVLRDPEPMVGLWEYTDKMYFRCQYFLDVVQNSLLELRSQIMFGIWDACRQEDIMLSNPMQDLYIREWPESLAVERRELATPSRPVPEQATPKEVAAMQAAPERMARSG